MRYYILTFGCQMNKSDSERMATILEKQGYKTAQKENEADLILVNMCSVRQSAVDRIYGIGQKLIKFKNQNPKLKTVLTGCILKEDREKLAKYFDLILNIKDLTNWPQIISGNNLAKEKPLSDYYQRCDYLKIGAKYQNNFSAFIPISNGCNFRCTYCVVPYVRGTLVCRPYQEILAEVNEVIKSGFKEIWLLGQIVNNYHWQSINFAQLLKMINDLEGDFWLRFTSPHPLYFSDQLIETMAKCQKVTPYLNLPLQSGDDEILKKMKRFYSVERYENLIKKIRQAFKKYRQGLEKEIALSTDIIVGFPGETEKQFQNTVKVLKKIKFDMAYVAQYSPRPGTTAAKMKNQISTKEKKRRWKIITEILRKTALKKNQKYLGKEVEVLIDESKNGFLFGKTRHYKTVKLLGPENLKGEWVKAEITDIFPWGLKGKLIKKC